MKLIRSIHSTELPANGSVATIGNFDAVHSGHREILGRLVESARERNLPAVVITFDPHPEEYFRPDTPSARLTTLSTRYFALRDCGVNVMLCLKFDQGLAHTSAEDFIRIYLHEAIGVRHLLIGDDFRFGARRAGDFDLLRARSEQFGYTVEQANTYKRLDNRVSSTWIRELLGSGELELAGELLGRRYFHTGRVVHGDKRGREWGFPTLNLPIRHRPALTGIFAVRVSGLEAQPLAGAASLGTRPTIDGSKTVLEVYLFGYQGDAYGRRVCVEFVEKIRPELHFDSIDELREQIARDVLEARRILEVSE